MKYEIKITSRYKKDYKNIIKRGYNIDLLNNIVSMLLYLIFIANNLMQLFLIRRLRKRYQTQREMVRILLKGLYLLKYRADIVFNSS